MASRWVVINKETGISHTSHGTQAEAERQAREMSEYHHKSYVAVERKGCPACGKSHLYTEACDFRA